QVGVAVAVVVIVVVAPVGGHAGGGEEGVEGGTDEVAEEHLGAGDGDDAIAQSVGEVGAFSVHHVGERAGDVGGVEHGKGVGALDGGQKGGGHPDYEVTAERDRAVDGEVVVGGSLGGAVKVESKGRTFLEGEVAGDDEAAGGLAVADFHAGVGELQSGGDV